MRLWLKDSERRPDPAPIKTDDRKAVAVGLALWIVALATLLVVATPVNGEPTAFWTCVAGITLGMIGLIYTTVRRRRGL